MKMFKVLSVLSILLVLTSCANSRIVSDPRDKNAVSKGIYEKRSEFGEHTIAGPIIQKEFGSILALDTLSVQLVKSENNYFVRIHNQYGGKWKFLNSITTKEREKIALQQIDRNVDSCSTAICYHTEIAYAPLNKSKHLSGKRDFRFRVNGKYNNNAITIPVEYIQVFLERAD